MNNFNTAILELIESLSGVAGAFAIKIVFPAILMFAACALIAAFFSAIS